VVTRQFEIRLLGIVKRQHPETHFRLEAKRINQKIEIRRGQFRTGARIAEQILGEVFAHLLPVYTRRGGRSRRVDVERARHPQLDVYHNIERYTRMRTNIVIDDKLMRDALRASGLKTKREAVEHALRTLVRLSRQGEIRQLRAKVDWQGDLDAMRGDG
jgi:Arc/MetJ family transcription regulator